MMCAFNMSVITTFAKASLKIQTIAFELQHYDCMIDREETFQCFLKILHNIQDPKINYFIEPQFLGRYKDMIIFIANTLKSSNITA